MEAPSAPGADLPEALGGDGTCPSTSELEIVGSIATTIGRSLNLDRMLRRVADRLLQVLPCSGIAIYLADPKRRELRLAVSVGSVAGTFRRHARSLPLGSGISGHTLERGVPTYETDDRAGTERRMLGPLVDAGVHISAAVPLHARNTVVGVLDVACLEPRVVPANERRLLETTGHLLGVAVENARLYARASERARRERLENKIAGHLRRSLETREIFATAVRELCRAMHASQCFLTELSGSGATVQHEYLGHDSTTLCGAYPALAADNPILRRAQAGHRVAIEDAATDPLCRGEVGEALRAAGVRSLLVEPLVVGGQTRAMLCVTQCDRTRAWSEEDEDLAAMVADHTALAVENAHLFERIRRSEQEYVKLYDEAPDMYHTVDASGRIVLCNATEARALGYRKDDLVGMFWETLGTERGASAVRKKLERFGRGGARASTFEMEIRRRDGEVMSVSVRAAPLYDGSQFVGARVVMRDITLQKRLEMQLLQAQKMESLGTLAGGIAHDFNNLLTGMIGYASLIKRQAPRDNPLHRHADIIEKCGRRAADLTQQMLAFARAGTLQMQPIDLNLVVRDTALLLTRTLDKHIAVEQSLEPCLWAIEADRIQMEQVLLNLCVNARDAMPDGGRLTVRTRNDSRVAGPSLDGPEAAPECFVVLSVSDTGHGMDETTRARIFDPFFTTKEPGKGTGLGLAMAYGIVTQHRGRIEVDSQPGRGSTFHIWLPALHEAALETLDREGEVAVTHRGTVLVVDDEAVIAALVRESLVARGMQVLVARDGAEAVSLYRERWREIDVVALDMMMPNMDGREAFWELRGLNPGAKILLLSGFSDDDTVQALLKAGARGFIRKPFPMGSLVAAIDRALREA